MERLSLKSIILDLEDLVLANAEGIDDSFDEIFKLIYAKLYDEWAASKDPSRNKEIHFRIYGESATELYTKINGLFRNAKDKWRGIFGTGEQIKLKPSHLVTCVSFLQDVKLFNANLQVIDEAFEYLITDIAKGKKGQFFTPRWVIDMCVKMLNPKINERFIDPACGSSGFGVHTIFWIGGQEFHAAGLPPHVTEYAGTMVFDIDSSPKAVKIAKALNLIAGDGKSNVYELNSLNPPKWNAEGKAAFGPILTHFDNEEENEKNQSEFQYFDFNVLMTNPPFAGNISEREILKQYRLAEKHGRTVNRMGRDILFIERCLNFLKPKGRMAIILPQGRLNNSNDLYIRNFFFEKARILAVVGLHGNTFKPHTGTKTSAIFLQKYTDEELDEIREIINKHEHEWNSYLEKIKNLNSKSNLKEDDLDIFLSQYLESSFEEPKSIEEQDNDETEEEIEETDEELKERIEKLGKKIDQMLPRAKGKAALKRAIQNSKYNLASRSLNGQIDWLINDKKLLEELHKIWLRKKASEELDYKIFFAVSKKGGKANSGEPIYKISSDKKPILDNFGHLIVDNDCNEIAEKFIDFSKKENFYFWS